MKQMTTHFSIAETCLVSIFPFVSSSGVMRPSNSKPSLAILTRISRTSSPMYIPLTIFSNLRTSNTHLNHLKGCDKIRFLRAFEILWLTIACRG